MKRRNFLKNISRLSAAPLLLNGLPISSFAATSMLPLLNCQGIDERVLVVLFLKGGNDGINTIVPINQYDTYATIRPDIALANTGANSIINLDTTLTLDDQVGLNPSMTAFKTMYENAQARLIQGVGYPDYNQSHFKSTDLWLTGGDGTPANFNLNSGWMGRYLESAYPGIYGNPTTAFPDPLGVQLGDIKSSLGFHNHFQEYIATNLTGQNPGNLFGLLNGLGTAPHAGLVDSDFGDAIDYIMGVENSTNAYGERISDVYNTGNNSSTTYPDTYLAAQLKIVARLLAGGSTTKIFLVHTSGFDTHANQVESDSPHTGKHATLLSGLFDAVKAFTDDLTNLGLEERVLTTTFSEFGRRATQNGSRGTDHGTLAPMFMFGTAAEAGVSGTNVDLGNLTNTGNLTDALQHDYRDVFKTLLQDWLGAGDLILQESMFDAYTKVPSLINPAYVVTTDCYLEPLSPLPVTLTRFEARGYGENQVQILWETSSEINHDYFVVERSQNGTDFTDFYQTKGVGDAFTAANYETFDEEPFSGISYYRLRSVDLDGSKTYSEIRVVELKTEQVSHLKLYPNPANFETNLVLTTAVATTAQLSVWDTNGRQVYERQIAIREGFNKHQIDVSQMPTGSYILRMEGKALDLGALNFVVSR